MEYSFYLQFLHLFEKQKGMTKDIFHLLVQSPKGGAGPGRDWEASLSRGLPQSGAAETGHLSCHLLPARLCISTELEQGAQLGLRPRPRVKQSYPKQHPHHIVQHVPLICNLLSEDGTKKLTKRMSD